MRPMILNFYKLREQPFGNTPDSRYLYLSPTHREALGSLVYGLETGCGFLALIAKPGMGKTTLLFDVLDRFRNTVKTVFLFQTMPTRVDCLRAILADLGIHEASDNLFDLQSRLNEYLKEQSRSGKRLLIVVDEAQALDDSVLELVRMLSNFETGREKLIQIVLSGQPQLADKLATPELLQLRQRISMLTRLEPLSPEETGFYVEHRLQIAGCTLNERLFTAEALALIAQWSRGIPRNINNLCFNALSLGCALKRKRIDEEVTREVIRDFDLEALGQEKASAGPLGTGRGQQEPVLTSGGNARSMRMRWLPKVAIAFGLLLGLAGLNVHGRRWFFHERLVHANAATWLGVLAPSSPALAQSSSFAVSRTLQLVAPASIIRVAAGESLYGVCRKTFGICNQERLQQIYRLNPWLSNPEHIETGQKLRVPAIRKLLITSEIPAGFSPSEIRPGAQMTPGKAAAIAPPARTNDRAQPAKHAKKPAANTDAGPDDAAFTDGMAKPAPHTNQESFIIPGTATGRDRPLRNPVRTASEKTTAEKNSIALPGSVSTAGSGSSDR